MAKIIAAMNTTLDGFCDHTAIIADDEIQPTVVGSGLPLFKKITDRIDLKLLKTKAFGCGAIFLYYEPR